MVSIVILYMVLRVILRLTENGPFYTLLGITRFHCMAIGGIGALLVFEKRQLLNYIYHPIVQFICWAIMIVSLYRPFHTFSIIDGELYALIFLVMIINVSTNPASIINLENKVLNWLGKTSYGIYVYHMFSIAIVFSILEGRIDPTYWGMALVYITVLGSTLLFAHLSYRYYEIFFLRLKHKFAIIKSQEMHSGPALKLNNE
jgi:peptidoglycan/LPS O-acetylase OafA/YrhL